MTAESYATAMTAPLTPEQAREQLRADLESLYRCDPFDAIATQLCEWRAVNIGRARMLVHLAAAQDELATTAERMKTALDVLTREPQPARATWLERLRTWAIGGRSH